MSENCTHDCSSCGVDCPSRQQPQSFLEKTNDLSHVKKVIGVVSGKGGVGKSLITSLLATTLRRRGNQVAVLDAVESSHARFGAGVILSILLGQETDQTARWHLERLDVFGRLVGVPAKQVRAVIDALLEQGYLQRSQESEYPILVPGPNARALRSGQASVALRQTKKQSTRKAAAPIVAGPVDEGLFQRLRELRGALARRKGVPAYVIFSDKTLREMAAAHPTNRAQLAQISGVGSHKLEQYGDAFLEVLTQS